MSDHSTSFPGPVTSTAEALAVTAPPASIVAEHIASVLKRHGGALPGTTVATAIRNQFPDFSFEQYGVHRLRDFLTRHAADIVVMGRQGMDILVDVKANVEAPLEFPGNIPAPDNLKATATSGSAVSQETNVWRAFTSPNSGGAVRIEVDRKTGSWRSVSPSSASHPGWVAVSPLTDSTHREIANAFLENESRDVHDLLKPALDIASSEWWRDLRAKLRLNPKVADEFGEFRLLQVQRKLRETLRENRLDPAAIEAAVDKATAHSPRSRRAKMASTTQPAPGMKETVARNSLHALALRVVARMNESELRELHVRLGDVFDVLVD